MRECDQLFPNCYFANLAEVGRVVKILKDKYKYMSVNVFKSLHKNGKARSLVSFL